MKKLIGGFQKSMLLSGLVLAVSIAALAEDTLPKSKQEEPVLKIETAPPSNKEAVGGLLYGNDHSYLLGAPKGWVLDNQSGKPQGLVAVFYPKGGSWANSPSVMYSRIQPKKGKTFAEAIQWDIDYMKKQSPMIQVTEQAPITYGKEKKQASVRYLTGEHDRNLEAVAYMEEANWVVLVVLTSRNEQSFKESLPAFKELVESYVYLTDQVKIEK